MTSSVQDVVTAESRQSASSGVLHDLVTLALAGLIVLCLQAVLLPAHVPLALKAELALIVVVTLMKPFAGLLTTAALVPFNATAALVSNAPHVLWTDAVMFAFVSSWVLSTRIGGGQRRSFEPVSSAGLVLGIFILGSCLAQLLQLSGGRVIETVWRIVARDLFFVGRRTAGLGEGLALLQGLALFAATIAVCGSETKRARALAATVVGAAIGAAILSILLTQGIGFGPVVERARTLAVGRFVAHISDVNSAGAYFAMMACVAVALAGTCTGLGRVVWMTGAVIIGIGMWLTASWAAIASGLVMLTFLIVHWSAQALGRPLTPRMALVVMGVVLVLGLVTLAGTRRTVSPEGFIIRRQFIETAFRMTASAPVLGVGVGMFHPLSRRFMGPELGWSYGLENAHNYFLQIASELGILGLAAFLYFLYTVWTKARSSQRWRRDLLGAVTAVAAFLATWGTGHPLLVHEVAYPFWIVLALVIVWADRAVPDESPRAASSSSRRRRVALAATAAIVFASVPFRAEAPTRQTVMYGVYDWELQPDGRRVRWTEQSASVVVRLETGAIDIPMRAPQPIAIQIAVDGVHLKYVALTEGWQQVRIALPPPAPEILYRRIDFRLPRSWTLAEIQPGSRDGRAVGIQIGELSLSPVR